MKQHEYFNNLWKVKMMVQLIEIEKEGKVTRDVKRDNERALSFIRYGFYAGIKYAKETSR